MGEGRSEGLQTSTFLIRSVLEFGKDHINNLEVKDLKVLLFYYFGLEIIKVVYNKVELMKAVTEFFRNYWGGLVKR